ncbi:MAG: hypothetical protein EAZ89_00260 [Bacteroidetes bacterium]|nr:MAG: hypothetical protein EAZ89_00260 [Bacteroidota bacterium]
MPTIKELRQAGQLEEALALAQEFMRKDPESLDSRRQLGWVLYDYAKKTVQTADLDTLLAYTDQILGLGLHREYLLSTQMAWLYYKISQPALRREPAPYEKMAEVLEKAKLFEYDLQKDPTPYVLLLRIAMKIKDFYPGLLEFIEWWDLDHLPESEFQPFATNQGLKVMALAEQAYIAYAKRLIDLSYKDPEGIRPRMEAFLPKLSALMEAHPEYGYPPYFKGQILLVLGRYDEVESVLLPFLRRKPMEIWGWSTLGSAYDKLGKIELAIACYAKTLTSRAKPEALLRVREQLAQVLLRIEHFAEAKTEMQEVMRMRQYGGRPLSPRLLEIQASDWFQQTEGFYDNRELYEHAIPVAEEMLYGDAPAYNGVVLMVNAPKRVVAIRLTREIDVQADFALLRERLQPGDFVRVRVDRRDSRTGPWYKPLTVQMTDDWPSLDVVTPFRGLFEMRDGQAFGFVDRKYYLPLHLIEMYQLIPGQQISGIAVIEFNKKRESWGWKVLKLDL